LSTVAASWIPEMKKTASSPAPNFAPKRRWLGRKALSLSTGNSAKWEERKEKVRKVAAKGLEKRKGDLH